MARDELIQEKRIIDGKEFLRLLEETSVVVIDNLDVLDTVVFSPTMTLKNDKVVKNCSFQQVTFDGLILEHNLNFLTFTNERFYNKHMLCTESSLQLDGMVCYGDFVVNGGIINTLEIKNGQFRKQCLFAEGIFDMLILGRST